MTKDGQLDILHDKGVKFKFQPETYPTSKVRSIGFTWDSKIPAWVGNATQRNYDRLTDWFDLSVTPQVLQYLSTQQQIPQIEGLPHELFPYQVDAVNFLVAKPRALLGLAPGLGKTFTSLIAADQFTGTKLIIAPLSLLRNWQMEIVKWIGEESQIWHRKIGDPSQVRWTITNIETAVKYQEELSKMGFVNVILDESILVKNRKAKRTKAIKALVKKVPTVWLLSGAPISKFADDIWAQLNILDPKDFSSYWRFVERYCDWYQDQWGRHIHGNKDLDMLMSDLEHIYFARTQDQVLDLPPWIFRTFPVPMKSGQYKAYLEMEEEFMMSLPDDDESVLAPNALVKLLRLLQISSNPGLIRGVNECPKWDAARELIDLKPGPILIWTSFKTTARVLYDILAKKGRKIAVLTGDTPAESRSAIANRFQSGLVDVLIAHPAVGKFGLNLFNAKTVIYLERNFNGDDFYQSLHRVRRIGMTGSPEVIFLLTERPTGRVITDTVDWAVHRVLDYRKNSTIKMTTGKIKEALYGQNY